MIILHFVIHTRSLWRHGLHRCIWKISNKWIGLSKLTLKHLDFSLLNILLGFVSIQVSLLLSHLLLNLLHLISKLVILALVHFDYLLMSIIFHLKLILNQLWFSLSLHKFRLGSLQGMLTDHCILLKLQRLFLELLVLLFQLINSLLHKCWVLVVQFFLPLYCFIFMIWLLIFQFLFHLHVFFEL